LTIICRQAILQSSRLSWASSRGHSSRRSRERRPARGACTPAPGRPRAPLSGHYDPGARSSLTVGPTRPRVGPPKTRPRLHNAAVERREASALRHWARDASSGVSRVPRWARSGAAFRTSASRRHTPSCARERKEAPPGALHGRRTGRPGRRSVGLTQSVARMKRRPLKAGATGVPAALRGGVPRSGR